MLFRISTVQAGGRPSLDRKREIIYSAFAVPPPDGKYATLLLAQILAMTPLGGKDRSDYRAFPHRGNPPERSRIPQFQNEPRLGSLQLRVAGLVTGRTSWQCSRDFAAVMLHACLGE